MSNFDKELAEKFFNNTCSDEEAKRVLKWFDTSEGRRYLEKVVDSDFSTMDEDDEVMKYMVPGLDSEKLWKSLSGKIKLTKAVPSDRKDYLPLLLKVAASLLVILTASFFHLIVYDHDTINEEMIVTTPVHFATSQDQQKEITLGDGSKIRLNYNSEIWISSGYLQKSREVELRGEAYFDVEPNSEKPFLISVSDAVIRVLGTAFNVKSYESDDNVQVAVTNGSIAFGSVLDTDNVEPVVLSEGQYGYMDLSNHQISVEDFGVENYLSWMSGRLVFDGLSLEQVCYQIQRLYYMKCEFEEQDLKELNLTANFSDDSVEKTLSVISLTLDIKHQISNRTVIWQNESL